MSQHGEAVKAAAFFNAAGFKRLFLGLFLGTFAGLLVVGSLRILGSQYNINDHVLVLGITVFSLTNFLGRLVWGWLSDHWGAVLCIFLALLMQSLSILSFNLALSDFSYLFFSALTGFSFGGNFVLFAKETAQLYGVANLGKVYPYVFMGYAIAGIAGPVSGGLLYDIAGTYFYSIILASAMSFTGSMAFLFMLIGAKRRADDGM
jgi:OFA family oxalate/formate antiporter-like MFS transporter